jgi:FixJ family two-component response regulator
MPPRRKLIALIDDDPSCRKAIDRQITAAGFRCQAFENAEDYLRVAAVCGAAAIVSDVHLGGLSGLELAVHPAVVDISIPVVLISGSADPNIEASAQQIATAFLRKPIPPGKLLDAIVDAVGPPISDGEEDEEDLLS